MILFSVTQILAAFRDIQKNTHQPISLDNPEIGLMI